MGRQGGATEVKRVESDTTRRVMFIQRVTNLLKKAKELSILCDAEVGVIAFSEAGKCYEYASTSMEGILSRYRAYVKFEHPVDCKDPSTSSDADVPITPSPELIALKQEVEILRTSYMQLTGRDLEELSFEQLLELEQHLANGLNSVKEKIKEQVLVLKRLSDSRNQETKLAQENVALRKQVEDLRHALARLPSMNGTREDRLSSQVDLE